MRTRWPRPTRKYRRRLPQRSTSRWRCRRLNAKIMADPSSQRHTPPRIVGTILSVQRRDRRVEFADVPQHSTVEPEGLRHLGFGERLCRTGWGLRQRTQRPRGEKEHGACSRLPIETFGNCPMARFTPKAVRILRDRKAQFPEAANGRVKVIRAIFRWALD